MSSALGRLKALLDERRDHVKPPAGPPPGPASVSFVREGGRAISESQPAPPAMSGAAEQRLGGCPSGKAPSRTSDSPNAPTAPPDRTDRSRGRSGAGHGQRRFNAEYLAEFRPGPDAPNEPCSCGDTVFYKLARNSPWRCRLCEPPNPHLEVRWFALPRTIGDASRVAGPHPGLGASMADQSVDPDDKGPDPDEDVL